MTTVIFLGTSAASPSVERGFSCIGVVDEDITLMDCGDGAIRNILKFGVDVRNISNILLTHYHSDHLSGLTQIIETMSIRKKQGEVNIYGPPGLSGYLSAVQRTTNVALHRNFAVNVTEMSAGKEFTLGDKHVSTFEMDHTLPCLGYRLGVHGRIISFTGDTQPCSALRELGMNSDIFIHEATFLQKDIEKARPPKHSTPLDAATAASLANASSLVLTHVNDDNERSEAMLLEAKRKFDRVTVANDGLRIDL